MQSLQRARAELATAQKQLASNPPAAGEAATAALRSSQTASRTFNNPAWKAVSWIPYFGATPKAAGAVSQSLTQALRALEPGFDQLTVLVPSTMVSNGAVNISAVQQAVPIAEAALPGVRRSQQTLQDAPTSGLLLGPVREATAELGDQLATVDTTLTTAVTFGKIAGSLMGQDSPKRYFLGLLNPNETRGTGGFLGTYAILTADRGKITVDQIGSNSDLANLTRLPDGLGKEFSNRYGTDPILRGNMNLSPHFPDTAAIWLASWRLKTGEQLDGAMALDVTGLSELVTATGQAVTLPDGSTMTGDQLREFALRDIYVQFPDKRVRKEYQEAVAKSALDLVTTLPKPVPMAEAMSQAFSENRIVVWSDDPKVEKELNAADVGGSLVVPKGHYVKAVSLNASGSKLDAWLNRSSRYDVGRCEVDGRVESSVTVTLRSDVPLGQRPPPYMIGQAQMGSNGPINFTILQVHLPKGSQVNSVTADGKQLGRFDFTEQSRPATLVAVDLEPRVTERVTVQFSEPASDGPGTLQIQPLASNEVRTVTDVPCS